MYVPRALAPAVTGLRALRYAPEATVAPPLRPSSLETTDWEQLKRNGKY
jgi:hypothetical protein